MRKKMEERWSIFISAPIPELVENLTKLRRESRNYNPKRADLLRQAMTIGLRVLIKEERDEAEKQQAQESLPTRKTRKVR